MKTTFDIGDIGPANDAARAAADLCYVPPCVEIESPAFFLFRELVHVPSEEGQDPKLMVLISHRETPGADPEDFRDPSVTTIKILKHPNFVAGDAFDAELAMQIFRSDARRPTTRQTKFLRTALTGVDEYAETCTHNWKQQYRRAKGVGVKAFELGMSKESWGAIRGDYNVTAKTANNCGKSWLCSRLNAEDRPFDEMSILTVAAAAGVLAAGLVRAGNLTFWKNKATDALPKLKSAAERLGIEIYIK